MPRNKNQISKIKYQKVKSKFKNILFVFCIIILSFAPYLLIFNKAHAQPGRSYEGCDLCGWCGITPADKPKGWEDCMRCLFPTRSVGLRPILTPGQPYTGEKPWALDTNPYYPSHPEVPRHWTVFGCLETAPGGFVNQLYKIILSIASGFAFLAFVYGGFQVLTAGGDPIKVSSGKNIIMGAVFGILLIVFSVFLLRLIGLEIIKIPGFG